VVTGASRVEDFVSDSESIIGSPKRGEIVAKIPEISDWFFLKFTGINISFGH
jgi:hypothetical protein